MDRATTEFTDSLWQFYAKQGRNDLPWRQTEASGQFAPYKIMVSELMLQQTQVGRVISKYHEFLMIFPDAPTLAAAPLAAVLKVWSGLGYNRRAKFLWQAAQKIVSDFGGTFPQDLDGLVSLPGVGKNTAGAILAYAFNQPVIFIETNIRTVYIHHFFQGQSAVSDTAILALVAQTLDSEHPREFYWALMDYGSYLKQTIGNASKFSKTYTKQSKFVGSRRQIRGQVLRLLAANDMTLGQLTEHIADERLAAVMQDLLSEQLVQFANHIYHL